jgi:hypothetical protein
MSAVEARLDAIDDKVADLRQDLGRERGRVDLIDGRIGRVEVQIARTDTTIKVWGKILLVGVPLLTSLGAWAVMRLTTIDLPAKVANAAIPSSAAMPAAIAASPGIRSQPQ